MILKESNCNEMLVYTRENFEEYKKPSIKIEFSSYYSLLSSARACNSMRNFQDVEESLGRIACRVGSILGQRCGKINRQPREEIDEKPPLSL